MSRIRSIHPGFFTDEAVLECSLAARLLYLGLLVEADCHGVFQWRPVQLKVRLLPMEPFDGPAMTALLQELAQADLVKRYEVGGQAYGVVKGFQKYQRPKNPAYLYPLPDEYRNYALSGSSDGGGAADKVDPLPQDPTAKVIVLPQRSPSAPPAEGENARMEPESDRRGEDREGVGGDAPRKRGSRLAATWALTPELLAYGVGLGLTTRQVAAAAERFRLHWGASAGRNAVKLDWNLAFQGWLRDDVDRKGIGAKPTVKVF